MGDVVNLSRARKRKVRGHQAAVASANRLKFGAPKATRERTAKEAALIRRTLDGSKLDRP
ncbi:MAG: DUF4169 family protein [Alphaproteobacteria bacterium]|nr:DUF4169 family protein [Alphaproteobacteria bacterium]